MVEESPHRSKADVQQGPSPRLYQVTLFEQAKEENVIAVLGTGTGKTLIALLLLKHMWELEHQRKANTKKRVSVFLVPTVPLVTQQAQYIKHNSDMAVKFFYGAMGVDWWTETRWNAQLPKVDCLVMTPAIFESILRRNIISMQNINLLVFDECHHAQKNAVYNQIMGIHYRSCPEHLRPKVFGMTASPTATRKNSQDAIRQLENNLFCKAVTVNDDVDLQRHWIKPMEETITYMGSNHMSPLINGMLMKWPIEHPPLLRFFRDSMLLIRELGPWIGGLYLFRALNDVKYRIDYDASLGKPDRTPIFFSSFLEEFGMNESLFDDTPGTLKATVANIPELLEHVDDTLSFVEEYFSEIASDVDFQSLFSSWSPPYDSLLSDKLSKLISILSQYADQSEDFCGIVFVERRATATILQSVLESSPALHFLRVGVLVGHGTGNTSSSFINSNMAINRQRAILEQFRTGKLNLLIATRVAEEGIDIQPCMLVIRFDKFMTMAQYVQSRGRARHPNARYVLMLAQDDDEGQLFIEKVRNEELVMNRMLQLQATEAHAEFGDNNLDSLVETFKVNTTGAVATTLSAVGSLYHYCSLLPGDSHVSNAPRFAFSPSFSRSSNICAWVYGAQLPMSAPLACRTVLGNGYKVRNAAKRSAALSAIEKLYENGELDDRLRPVHFGAKRKGKGKPKGVLDPDADDEDDDDEDDDEEMEETKETPQIESTTTTKTKLALEEDASLQSFTCDTPQIFKNGWTDCLAWLVLLRVKDKKKGLRFLTFGLLCPGLIDNSTINSIQIRFGGSVHVVEMHVCSSAIDCAGMQEQIQKCGKVVYEGIIRTHAAVESELYYVPVPLKENAWNDVVNGTNPKDVIDWETCHLLAISGWAKKDAVSRSWHATKGKDITFDAPVDQRVAELRDLFGRLGSEMIVGDHRFFNRKYRVIEIVETSPQKAEIKEFDSVAHFYQEVLEVTEPIVEDQPIFMARAMPHIKQSGGQQGKAETAIVQLIPQFCEYFPVAASSFVDTLTYIPLIVHELNHWLIAADLHRNLELDGIVSIRLLKEALTAASSDSSSNYERLEFLGDAFLKMELSIHLFSYNPGKNEGWLSRTRNFFERNKSLTNIGVRLGLPSKLQTSNLTRKSWKPPQTIPVSQVMSDKTIADAIEAIIGACYLESGIDGGATVMKKLFNAPYELEWGKYITMYNKTSAQAISLTGGVVEDIVAADWAAERLLSRVEDTFGYKFKKVELLKEAVTHPSYNGMEMTASSCYQRLEYLGDAVLSLVVSQKLFNLMDKYGPGQLTIFRTELINNQFLAVVACRLGLPKLLLHRSGPLASALADFTSQYQQAHANWREVSKSSVHKDPSAALFWKNLVEAPKAAGDIIEALLGAILLDSDGDMTVVAKIIEQYIIKPWWKHFEVGIAMGGFGDPECAIQTFHTVKSRMKCRDLSLSLTGDVEANSFTCIIQMHGQYLAEIVADSKRNAKRGACSEALEQLRAEEELQRCVCIQETVDNGKKGESQALSLIETVDEADAILEKIFQ